MKKFEQKITAQVSQARGGYFLSLEHILITRPIIETRSVVNKNKLSYVTYIGTTLFLKGQPLPLSRTISY